MAYISVEDVAAIRKDLQEAFPAKDGWKFSVRRDHATSVDVRVMRAPKPLRDVEGNPVGVGEPYGVNPYWYPDQVNLNDGHIVEKMLKIIKKKWWDESDIRTDYFHTAFYFNLGFGRWDKPCEYLKTS